MSNTYIWELGIDMDALAGPANASYLPGGFILPGSSCPIQRPVVLKDDQIIFRIFDLTKERQQAITMQSFTVNPRPAVQGQSNVAPLNLQPTIPNPNLNPNPNPSQESTYFGTSNHAFPFWESLPVTVLSDAANKKFLLNFFVQVLGATDGPRTFVHDPEMVVGPNM
jgi:hypothetical protein